MFITTIFDLILPYWVRSVKVAVAVYVSALGTGVAPDGTVISNSMVEVAPVGAAEGRFTISNAGTVGSIQHLVALVVPLPELPVLHAEPSLMKESSESPTLLEETV